jgi:hypothetical protein
MQKKALPVRVDIEAVNNRAQVISDFAGIDRAKVIRCALSIGLDQLSAAPEAMTPDECYMMIHKGQEIK